MSTPIRPPNIPPGLWKLMSPEDQQQARIDFFGPEAGPPIGGFAPPPPAPPPKPPPTPTSLDPKDAQWVWVRNLNSFPGNHPFFDDDRKAGVTGYMLKADDPFLIPGADACHGAGFMTGVWDMPKNETPEQYAARMVKAKHDSGSRAISPDTEAGQKGGPGSPGWQYNVDAAAALAALDPGGTLIVTPLPLQDDFNYGAWIAAGAVIWAQCYGATLDDVFDPGTVAARLRANGVPLALIGLLLPAGHVQELVPKVAAAGVTHWAVYPIDDVTPGDRSVPFGPPPGGPKGGSPPSGGDDAIPPGGAGGGGPPKPTPFPAEGITEGPDTEIDAAYEIGPFSDEDLAEAEAIEADLYDFGGSSDGAIVFSRAKDATPGGSVHPTAGWAGYPAIDFWARAGTILVAPFYGVVRRYSGHSPGQGWPEKPGGPWGWTIYFRASPGYDFFITHLGTRIANLGAVVAKGQPLGVVGHIPSGPTHAHIGVWDGTAHYPGIVRSAGGLVIAPKPWQAEKMRALAWYDRTPGSTGPPGPQPEPTKTSLTTQHVEDSWHGLMRTFDTAWISKPATIRAAGRSIAAVVRSDNG